MELSTEEDRFLVTSHASQELNEIRSNHIRAFLRSNEIRGGLSAISMASNTISTNSNVKKLSFNLQKESNKYRLNLKNKSKKNKIRAISYDFTLIPKKCIS